jgi:hypothetical protein
MISKLSYVSNLPAKALFSQGRHDPVLDAALTHATGTAAREVTLLMLDRRKRRRRISLGTDKAYHVEALVHALRARHVSPHVALSDAIMARALVQPENSFRVPPPKVSLDLLLDRIAQPTGVLHSVETFHGVPREDTLPTSVVEAYHSVCRQGYRLFEYCDFV